MNQTSTNHCRQEELQILADVARSIGRNHKVLPSDKITGFMAMQGCNYNRDLMVVGKAVNGWAKKTWEPELLASEQNVGEFVDDILKSVTATESCPMQWVSRAWGSNSRTNPFPSNWDYHGAQDYNSRKSAFWRVIREIVGELNLADIETDVWPSCLVWSNLYKISPAAGGNPSAKQRNLQLRDCISLLEAEILFYKPRRLLFLTGYEWVAPFLQHIAPSVAEVQNTRYVCASGKFNPSLGERCSVVIAVHPQGKNKKIWVEEVLKFFQE